METIETDGHVYDRPRDPPGQRSIYIPPGDNAQEAYRLSTFVRYPPNIPINQRHLASNGFYYTGYKDRVKCFCCGLCVENWTVGDDPKLPRWHRDDCEFIKGESCGNIPIAGLFSRLRKTATRSHKNSSVANSTQQSNNSVTTTATAVPNVQSSLLPGSIHQPGSNIPMQTARPVPSQHSQEYQRIDFAVMPSAHHEHLVLSLDLHQESDRLRTFELWPSHPRSVSPSHLARYGFFYLGNLDRVQCFSCGGILRNWNFDDNVKVEHQRHFPHCKLIQDSDSRNIPMQAEERANYLQQHTEEPTGPSESELRNLAEVFPCLYPVNPHMRNEESRLETFDHRWPSDQVHATTQQIAKAGFFFLGDRDRVKCWYCNGGLQNWDPDDEPWTEHAKWFPICEFLLQHKGHDFVSRLVALHPNLPRPVMRARGGHPNRQNYQISFGENNQRSLSPPPPIIDPKLVRIEQLKKLNEAMESDIVKSAVKMGFTLKLVRVIVKRRLQNSAMFSSVSELVEVITSQMDNLSDSEDSESLEESYTESKIVTGTPSLQAQDHENERSSHMGESMDQEENYLSEGVHPSIEGRIRELQDERKCKICFERVADVVFVPCGHICSCVECAKALGKCPMCRRKIEKSIRTYMS